MILAGIVAGGTGTRMGGYLPKQFYDLNGKPVLIRTAACFLNHPRIDAVIIGIHPDWYEEAQRLLRQYFPDNPGIHLTCGGSDRNETVCHLISFAQKKLSCSDSDIILTHDAVRPFVTERMITESICAMEQYAVCTAVIPETDTVVVSQNGSTANDFPDRSTLFRVQTPQTFRVGSFLRLYQRMSTEERQRTTDVCRLYQSNGYEVGLISGEQTNIKLTYPLDIRLAQLMAQDK